MGSAAVIDFWRDHAHAAAGYPALLSILLPPRSLLSFTDAAYTDFLHGVAARRYDEMAGAAGPANWTSESRGRWNVSSKTCPAWASRQLEPADGWDSSAQHLPEACSLRREERFSLTLRRAGCPASAEEVREDDATEALN